MSFTVRRADQPGGLPSPSQLSSYSGVCILGGVQHVYDDLPWMRKEIDLIRTAADRDLPVIGHCLGGQIISKALDGAVDRHHRDEVGWHCVSIVETPGARHWLDGMATEVRVFQWHEDVFSLPAGAELILTGEFCDNQAFVHGNMLALQFHPEVTEKLITHWMDLFAGALPPPSECVQTESQILENLAARIAESQRLADTLYDRWIRLLSPD